MAIKSIDAAYPVSSYRAENKVGVPFTGVQEAAICPLIARAMDARADQSVLNDMYAPQILDRIDHDIDKFKIDDTSATVCALRIKCVDRWTAEFLANNPQATVLNLACGLDTRWHRLQPDLTQVRWIDLDLPDIVRLRSQLIPNPEGDYYLIAADVTDKTWIEQIPADRPTIVICQGLLMFLEEDAAKRLIRQIAGHFTSGQLILDLVGTIMLTLQTGIEYLKVTGSSFRWGVDEPKTLEGLHPRLKMIECLGSAEFGDVSCLPLTSRLMFSTYSDLPWFRYLTSYARFSF